VSDDLIERLSETYEWIRKGSCCGEVCTDGICMAPACSFGLALDSIGLTVKRFHTLYGRIEELEAENLQLREQRN